MQTVQKSSAKRRDVLEQSYGKPEMKSSHARGGVAPEQLEQRLTQLTQILTSTTSIDEGSGDEDPRYRFQEFNGRLIVHAIEKYQTRLGLLLTAMRYPSRHPSPLFTCSLLANESTAQHVQVDTRVYDVGDLLLDITFLRALHPMEEKSPRNWSASVADKAPHDIQLKSTGVAGALDGVSQLLMVIIVDSTGDPADWGQNGGHISTVSIFDSALVITATPAVHQEVSALLDALRRGNAPNNR